MKLTAEPPKLIAGRSGYFWFPKLHRLNDKLICMVATTADRGQGYWPAFTYVSGDQGKTWTYYNTLNYAHSSINNTEESLLLLPYEFWPTSSMTKTAAKALGQFVAVNGDAPQQQNPEIVLSGFPKPLAEYHQEELCLWTSSSVLKIDGRFITTVYGRYADEKNFSVFSMISSNQGLTWEFQSCIAGGKQIINSREGANESDSMLLEDGRILCVFRVGSGEEYPYYKSYSADGGNSWTDPEEMTGMFSVEPQLLRLGNGLIVLAGGRPGLFIWICADGEGRDWRQWDLLKHHNQALKKSNLHFDPIVVAEKEQTTSYLSLAALDANQFVVCYDRLSNGWDEASEDSENRVFSVTIKTEPRG